jgi:hypothetical protein
VCRGVANGTFFRNALDNCERLNAFLGLDLGAKSGDGPIAPIRHRLFEQRCGHPQGSFAFHRRRTGGGTGLQGLDTSASEITPP